VAEDRLQDQAGLGEDEAGSDVPAHPGDAVLVVLGIGDGAPSTLVMRPAGGRAEGVAADLEAISSTIRHNPQRGRPDAIRLRVP
jgi:hypothetical protein